MTDILGPPRESGGRTLAKTPVLYKARLSLCTLGTFSSTSFETFNAFGDFCTVILWLIYLLPYIFISDSYKRPVILA